MNPFRFVFVVIGSMVGSAVALGTTMIVTTALAAVSGVPMRVPGLIAAAPGEGNDLATASLGGTLEAWFVVVTLAFVAGEFLVARRRRSA